jgi:hypothetical protein
MSPDAALILKLLHVFYFCKYLRTCTKAPRGSTTCIHPSPDGCLTVFDALQKNIGEATYPDADAYLRLVDPDAVTGGLVLQMEVPQDLVAVLAAELQIGEQAQQAVQQVRRGDDVEHALEGVAREQVRARLDQRQARVPPGVLEFRGFRVLRF